MAITLFRIGLFGAAHRWKGVKRPSLPKICQTYPTMITLSSYTLAKEGP